MVISDKYLETYSDKKLMNLISKRNDVALKIIYKRYNVSIYNFVVRYTGNREIAEDILQETFIRVWYAAHTFDKAKGNFKAWLFTIGLNITRNEMKKNGMPIIMSE